ncbi:MAG: GAF domain-containing protein [Thermodesulfovibrionales bacterium]|nr:GAF domain-containing protein [Thermodesulfovibrionales bacterium]
MKERWNSYLSVIKSHKRIFFTFFIASITIYFIGYIYYIKGKEERFQNIREQLDSIVSLKVQIIEKWREERISDARFILNNEGIANRLMENLKNKKMPPPPWMSAMYNNGKYNQIAFFDDKMTNFIKLPEKSTIKINEYTKTNMTESIEKESIIFSEPFRSNDGMIFIDLVIPIKVQSDKKFIGWVILRIDFQESITSFFAQMPLLRETYETILVQSNNGSFIYLHDIKSQGIKALISSFKIDDLSIKDLKGELKKRATFYAIDYKGEEVVAASKKVQDTSWIVISKVEKDDVILNFLRRSIIFFFLTTGLLITSFVSLLLYLNSQDKERKIISYQENIDRLNRERENERKILHLNRLYSVLSAINRAIVRIYTEKELLEKTCKILVHIGGFKLAWVGVVDNDTKVVKPLFFWGSGDGYLDSVTISVDENIPAGKGPTGVALREGRYYVCNDILNDEKMKPWHEKSRERDFRSSGSFPIIVRGKLYGGLNLYSSEANFFDDAEIELCLEIANDVAYAMEKITEMNLRKRAEQQLRKLNEELEEKVKTEISKSREKDLILLKQARYVLIAELMNRISHQWRQPLNAVGLVLQNLEDMCECSEQKKEIVRQNIRLGMERILSLSATIDKFKNFFMPDSEKINFLVKEAIDTALNLIEDSLRENNILLENYCEQCEITIYGFKNEFSQVIVNIISNAMEVSLSRNIKNPIIKLECSMTEDKALLKITDNAGGIKDGIIDKIFEPYFTTKFEAEGVGLGLYISKITVEKNMGGSLIAKNVDGGAQFIISLPVVSS